MTDDKLGPVLEAVRVLSEKYEKRGYGNLKEINAVIAAYREATKPAPPPIEPGFYWARRLEPKSEDMVVEVAIAAGCRLVYETGRDDAYDLSEWVILARAEPPKIEEACKC